MSKKADNQLEKRADNFITDKNKNDFGHICRRCRNAYKCQKSKRYIILKCKYFVEKQDRR